VNPSSARMEARGWSHTEDDSYEIEHGRRFVELSPAESWRRCAESCARPRVTPRCAVCSAVPWRALTLSELPDVECASSEQTHGPRGRLASTTATNTA
jgi:hypothetical protein